MIKNVLLMVGLVVLSTSAFASKARMEALGQGSASYYLLDSRTVFVNPASLNDMKNYVVTEWGTASTTIADTSTTPRAEGGFFRESGTFAYGLYLGNNGTLKTASTAFLQHQNGVDFFLAGDLGVKWGAKVHYASAKDESFSTSWGKKNSAFGLSFGVIQGDLNGYINLALSDKSTGALVAGDVWKRKPGINVGASYKWSGISFFADYNTTNETLTAGTGGVTTWTVNSIGTPAATTLGTGENTHKTFSMVVGAAKIHEVNPTTRVVTDARLVIASDTIGGASTAAANGKAKSTKLPVTIALETDATSWLILRGSVSQNVVLGSTKNIAGQSTSVANSTLVNAGGTLNYGKLKIDGVVGTSASARNGALTATNTGVLATDNLMSRVGVTYNF